MSREADTGQELLSALERTLGRGSARIQLRFEVSWPDGFPPPAARRPADGPLWRRLLGRLTPVLGRLFAWGMRTLMAHFTKKMAKAEGATGLIDFEARRCVYGSGRTVELVDGDRHWSGAPGTSVGEHSSRPASAVQPLWLVDLVRGVVDAREQPAEHLDGRPARRFSAQADLKRAAESVSYQLALPSASGIARLKDLEHIPLEVWLDDGGHIRRIRHTSGRPSEPTMTTTLDLPELGVELPSDWSRLPALPEGRRAAG